MIFHGVSLVMVGVGITESVVGVCALVQPVIELSIQNVVVGAGASDGDGGGVSPSSAATVTGWSW